MPQITTPERSGLLANIPAAGSATSYFATDDHGGTYYRSTGTAWIAVSRGVTLAQTIATSNLSNQNNTTYADVTGMSISFTPHSTPFMVEVWIANLVAGGTFSAGGTVSIYQRLVNSDASTDYTGDIIWTGTGNLYRSGSKLLRRYFDVGDFTPNTSMTVKLQTKLLAASVTSPTYALIARMGIRAIEDV